MKNNLLRKLVEVGSILGIITVLSAPVPFRDTHYSMELEKNRNIDEKIVTELMQERAISTDKKIYAKSYSVSDFLDFPYSNELPDILKFAKMENIDPTLLMAIRMAENGEDYIAYGIKPTGALLNEYWKNTGYSYDGTFHKYTSQVQKQIAWAAVTVDSYFRDYLKDSKDEDFITYLAKRWAPVGAWNDPDGLNKNWVDNVKNFYEQFHKESISR